MPIDDARAIAATLDYHAALLLAQSATLVRDKPDGRHAARILARRAIALMDAADAALIHIPNPDED